jgi:hypothetical protein
MPDNISKTPAPSSLNWDTVRQAISLVLAITSALIGVWLASSPTEHGFSSNAVYWGSLIVAAIGAVQGFLPSATKLRQHFTEE